MNKDKPPRSTMTALLGGSEEDTPAPSAVASKTGGRQKRIPTSIKVDDDIYDDIRLLAWYDRINIGDVINSALRAMLAKRETDLQKIHTEITEEQRKKVLGK